MDQIYDISRVSNDSSHQSIRDADNSNLKDC